MSIPALEAVSGMGIGPTDAFDLRAGATAGPAPTGYIDRTGRTDRADAATGFAGALTGAIDSLGRAQARSSELGIAAVSGKLENVHDYTVAATEAQVALELTAAIRNKAVDAFNEIMRMQA